jgi:hypothetical protein
MSRKVANKAIRQGGQSLIPRADWCELKEIQGRDPDVLGSPTMERAFQAVLKLHRPTHPIALCSLCTTTRPYSAGKKWKALRQMFGGACDLIVTSNGGVIPLPFETQFPYLNYDAHGEAEFDAAYIAKLGARMDTFFRRHRYRYVMFMYRHNLRNARIAERLGPALKRDGVIEDFALLPTAAQYKQSQAERFHLSGYKMFPELYPTMLRPVLEQVKTWRKAA